jgi:S1-C subfamily serine protease
MGDRDRVALRVQQHRDRGNHQRPSRKTFGRPQPGRAFIQTDVAVNPQPGAAAQHARRGDRHQLADLLAHRRLRRHPFAIPIDYAFNVAEQLMKTGKVTRGRSAWASRT